MENIWEEGKKRSTMEFNKGRRRGKGNIARGMENDVSFFLSLSWDMIWTRRLEQEKERKSLRKNHFTWEKLYNYQKYDLFIEFENMYIY